MNDKYQLKQLEHLISTVDPVQNHEVKWLIEHRPSVAFVICIGAGPWKIGRRRKVQQSFIDALRGDDLSSRWATRRLCNRSQLEWQSLWFKLIQQNLDKQFDDLFWPGLGSKSDKFERFQSLIGTSIYKSPKVVQLFVRDYLFIPCFPVDRHVRRELEKHHLTTKSHELVSMFKQLGVNPSLYSRALFNAKAENPRFEPTR